MLKQKNRLRQWAKELAECELTLGNQEVSKEERLMCQNKIQSIFSLYETDPECLMFLVLELENKFQK